MQEPLPLITQGLPAPTVREQASRTGGARPGDWRIDPRTRRVGMRGLAQARAALAATHKQVTDGRCDAA